MRQPTELFHLMAISNQQLNNTQRKGKTHIDLPKCLFLTSVHPKYSESYRYFLKATQGSLGQAKCLAFNIEADLAWTPKSIYVFMFSSAIKIVSDSYIKTNSVSYPYSVKYPYYTTFHLILPYKIIPVILCVCWSISEKKNNWHGISITL